MANTVYKFLDFTLDLSQKRLLQGAQIVEFQRLSFELLSYLIQHRAKVVSIDELQKAVWGTIVTDAAVARAIMKVRKALDDDPSQPQLIRTVVRQGYQFIGTLLDDDSAVKVAPQETVRENSIAVLPLINMSGDPDNEYFGDGIAEEILNLLARMPDLRVTSRTSAFAFKNKSMAITDIAQKLQVNYMLEGSVRRYGNRVRITMQLIDCGADNHLWSETFEEELVDVFDIQDRIAHRVADSLDAKLIGSQQPKTNNPRAYDFYLRGRELFHRTDLGKMELAKQMFQHATNVDEQYAQAWAGISYACCWLHMWLEQSEENLHLSRSAAEKAVAINPGLADGQTALGFALTLANEFDLAARAFETAIELDRTLYEAWYLYGRARFAEGKTDLAKHLFTQAAACQPDEYQASCLVLNCMEKGSAEMQAAAAKAVIRVENHLELYPQDTRALTLGGGAFADLGETDRACDMAKRALAIGPEDISVLHNAGCIYASVGKIDRALEIFEKRLAKSMLYRDWIENDPDFDALRDHPRFIAMLADAEQRFHSE